MAVSREERADRQDVAAIGMTDEERQERAYADLREAVRRWRDNRNPHIAARLERELTEAEDTYRRLLSR